MMLGECCIGLVSTEDAGKLAAVIGTCISCKMQDGNSEGVVVAYIFTRFCLIEATFSAVCLHQNKAHLIDASHNQK